ncbi:MAG: hypothetical protein Q8Q40_09700 [Methylococcaceae bacterium]|nr:hypothetical protein [Methylococcaceae bacterium]MDP3904237.1 hypothetical protein [Methylococcaceae bacterium]
MNKFIKVSILIAGSLSSLTLQAAPRQPAADNGALVKLQATVKSLTAERDAATAEAAALKSEVEQLKKENSAAVSTKEQLGSELSAQKNSNSEVRDRLEKTNAKLLEVIEKYKVLNQAKADLGNELTVVKGKQQAAEQQLVTCSDHNVKLLQSGQELLDRYQSKGTLATLLQDEPILQFQSVEMETIAQEYQDKLNSGKYQK